MPLTPAPQRPPPAPFARLSEGVQEPPLCGHSLVAIITAHHAAEPRALIDEHLGAHGGNGPIVVDGHGHMHGLLVGMGTGQQVFATIFDPFNRTVQTPGQKAQDDRLRIPTAFDPKTPPDVGGNNPYIAFRDAKDVGKNGANLMWGLSGGPHGKAVHPRLEGRDDPADFQWDGRLPGKCKGLVEDDICCRESALHLPFAKPPVEENVIRQLRMNPWRMAAKLCSTSSTGGSGA